jgi:hypothetical protein
MINILPLWPLRLAIWEHIQTNEYTMDLPLAADNEGPIPYPFVTLESVELADQDTDSSNLSRIQVTFACAAHVSAGGGELVNEWLSALSAALSQDVPLGDERYGNAQHIGPIRAFLRRAHDSEGRRVYEGIFVTPFIIHQINV